MNKLLRQTALLLIFMVVFISVSGCNERSGYTDEEHAAIISMLTESRWYLKQESNDISGTQTHTDDTVIYKFDAYGKGWTASGKLSDYTYIGEQSYFRWSFTNGNYAVIRLEGSGLSCYWKIDKIRPEELCVTSCALDPVLYPNENTVQYKFKAME